VTYSPSLFFVYLIKEEEEEEEEEEEIKLLYLSKAISHFFKYVVEILDISICDVCR
jgi:hypothetical protein